MCCIKIISCETLHTCKNVQLLACKLGMSIKRVLSRLSNIQCIILLPIPPPPLLQVRRTNMIRDIQGKLEKQRRLLHDEEETVGGVNYQDYTTGELLQMDSDKQGFRWVQRFFYIEPGRVRSPLPLQEVLFPLYTKFIEMLLRWLLWNTSINLCFGSPHFMQEGYIQLPHLPLPLGLHYFSYVSPVPPSPKHSGPDKAFCIS